MKPDKDKVMEEARRLRDDRFHKRDRMLQHQQNERFGRTLIEIPLAYEKATTIYHSPALQEEGRQVATLCFAWPVPHIEPQRPEDQPLTTLNEQWLMAMLQELECYEGANWWKCLLSQVHESIGWIYFGMKRDAYAGGPEPPGEEAEPEEMLAFGAKNDRYKREAGIASVFDYRHVPTGTVYYIGDCWNPLRVYEIKEVDEFEVMALYGLTKDAQGNYTKPKKGEITTTPSGQPRDRSVRDQTRKVRLVEYWDRDWCQVIVENPLRGWFNRERQGVYVLDEWEHGWGRVPYFARPAFENETMDEDTKYESPLNGIMREIGMYNRYRTMMSNVAFNTGFAPFKIITKEQGDQILDDSGRPKTWVDFEPGTMIQLAPGQDALPIVLAPEGNLLVQETIASEQRMKQFSLDPVGRGVSPGADTANSAITQLRRLQRSSLEPLTANAARQAREIFKFALERVKGEVGAGTGETTFVWDRTAGEQLGLAPEDILTLNLQVKVSPDTGQDSLIEEKQAAELVQLGLITPLEFNERRGKENPEEYVRAQMLWAMFQALLPTMQQQILANLGDAQAIQQLIAANQQTGNARDAVPGLMEAMKGQVDGVVTGAGPGSGGLPRAQGVRSPAVQTTTQPQNGAGPYA